MKYLIVTADDLGLTKSINEGIVKACKEGVVTAVSVIPTGEAFEDAVSVIKDLNLEEIGAHLALTETKPLLDSSGFYKNHNQFLFNWYLGRIKPDDLYKELKAQLDLLKKTSARITHINSHEHVHMVPGILDIFMKAAKEYNIPAIRYPRGDRPAKRFALNEAYKSFVLSYFSKRTGNVFKGSGLLYTDFFLGLLDSGRLDENKLIAMLKTLGEGVTEIVTHPGFLSPEGLNRYSWHRACETELFALTSNKVKNVIKFNNIKPIKYQEFLSIKR